jgi:ribosomal protein S18 acetylase RimI-like enzyme
VGHIEDVSVKVEYQRKGIGFKLVNHATNQAAIMGCVKTGLFRRKRPFLPEDRLFLSR